MTDDINTEPTATADGGTETTPGPDRPDPNEITLDDLVGVFPRDTRMGNRVTIRDWDDRSVDGHLTPYVHDGDLFGYEMGSGRIAVFQLVDVDNCRDPPDMFFATARDVGYLYPDRAVLLDRSKREQFSPAAIHALAIAEWNVTQHMRRTGHDHPEVLTYEEPETQRLGIAARCEVCDEQTASVKVSARELTSPRSRSPVGNPRGVPK